MLKLVGLTLRTLMYWDRSYKGFSDFGLVPFDDAPVVTDSTVVLGRPPCFGANAIPCHLGPCLPKPLTLNPTPLWHSLASRCRTQVFVGLPCNIPSPENPTGIPWHLGARPSASHEPSASISETAVLHPLCEDGKYLGDCSLAPIV